MRLPMQGKKLLPGQQNIAGGGVLPRTPYRRRCDAALDAGHELGKASAGELSDEFQPFSLVVMADLPSVLVQFLADPVASLMGKCVDQRGLEPFCVGVAKFGLGQ